MAVLLLIIGLLLFVGLVVVHEFGHFIMAKRGGVKVEEFGIGFPPKVYSKKTKGGWLFSINLLPLGGFVKLKGENDADKSPGSFGAAPLKTKIKIMLAGVVMNLLTAFVLLTFLALIGMPQLIENQFSIKSDARIVKQSVLVSYVEPNSPAEKAGLQLRDRIVSLGSARINAASDFPGQTTKQAGKTVPLLVERRGQEIKLTATLRSAEEVDASKKTDKPKGYLGISPTEYILQRSTWSAPVVAVGFVKQVTVLTFKGLGTAISSLFQGDTGKASSQVSGPVGIFVLLKDSSQLGFQLILMIIAIISLTLAIMNVLPIPALDGGRLFVTLLFRTLGKPLNKKTEELIHGTGFMVLITLFVLITIVDVKRFF